jgi:methionyl-tRNA synthetase
VRWWLLRDVAGLGDTDFTERRLLTRYHQDLANGLGNLVNRTLSLVHRYRSGVVPDRAPSVVELCAGLPSTVDRTLSVFDLRGATDAIWTVVAAADRYVEAQRPWELARRERAGEAVTGQRLDAVLSTLVEACRGIAHELTPFLPAGAARLSHQLGAGSSVGAPRPVFPRWEESGTER